MMTSCLGEVINTLAAMIVLVISIFFLLGFFSWIFGGTITKNPKNGNNTNSDGGSCATTGEAVAEVEVVVVAAVAVAVAGAVEVKT
ncbi:hypothetical protein KUH03_29535 [Sphingobacterium sp. E70]|uniref:hypothetical protein n=1 Tax=Sphingobacterium sp. E70 TaxID=2853439 RepID=UPI00211C4DD9|nr:hypothetical protein [Sphingobacterium sp. E70]ULT23317.1 hypothetical protein KUH03_29535 [Sphingobacterium sp. E70]